jgi:glycosyltransferase involved in cell wall biosynthesis
MTRLKVVHIIVGLNVGGAEMMLYKLLKYSDRSKFNFEVISLMDKGVLGAKIEELGIPVHPLGMKRGAINLTALRKAKSIVKKAGVIQTWMYHADLFGFLIKNHIRNNQKLIWGIRHSNLEKDKNKKLMLLIAKLNAFLSKRVDLIISCSKEATKTHIEIGYDHSKIITIPNGFELDTFYKNSFAKSDIESKLKLPKGSPLMLHVGRWNVQKDYPNLIKSIKLVIKERSDITFLLCGSDIDNNNKELVELLIENGVEKNTYLLGKRDDIPNLLSGADALISSSLGEGFSNVIGEAMACELPCIVTDVGDSAYIVGSYGFVVPPQNSEKLAQAILDFNALSGEEKTKMGIQARERVMNEFEIKEVVRGFEERYIF